MAAKKSATASSGAASEVTVLLKNGSTRVFSQEMHGDNFAALAEEFCATNGATIAE